MPSRETHLRQAEANEQFARDLLDQDWSEACAQWAGVSIFYAALHLIDAYLADSNIHPSSHSVRGRLIATTNQLRTIYPLYEDLQNRSRDIRYDCAKIPPPFVRVLLTNAYARIKRHIIGLPNI